MIFLKLKNLFDYYLDRIKRREYFEPMEFVQDFQKTIRSMNENEFNLFFKIIESMPEKDWTIQVFYFILILEWCLKHQIIKDYEIRVMDDNIEFNPIFEEKDETTRIYN